MVDYHLSLLADPESLAEAERTPRIVVRREWLWESQAFLPEACRFVTIHPGSGSIRKNWPLERFYAVADELRKEEYSIVWIAGPAEEEWRFPAGDVLVKERPLPVIAALFSRSCLYIGNDSGITHLAAAVGCPAIAIFGSSDPAVWSPRGERVKVVYKKENCAPCHGTEKMRDDCGRECLSAIHVDEVIDLIDYDR